MGPKAKITPPQIYIIGAVLSIISAVVIYFTLWKPSKEAYDAAYADDQTQLATIAKMPQAQKDRKLAEAKIAEAKQKWLVYDRHYMPDINLTNRYKGWQQLVHEQVEVLGPKVEKFLRADHSVQILTDGLTTPAPPSDPNAVVTKAYTYPLGSFSVVGTFNDVLNHVARWNRFDRLVMVDGLTLTGSSPRLVAQYTLTAFETTHNFDTAGPAFPTAAPPTATAGGGGGGGGGGSAYEVTTPNAGSLGGPGGPGGPGGTPGRPGGVGGSISASGSIPGGARL